MRIRWRGLELPTRVVPDPEVNTDTFGRFTVEPFERGFGTTVGNSLRRILLSSLEGAAVSAVKIRGAEHEFASLDGVQEDVTDMILNLKNLVVSMEGEEPCIVQLSAEGPGEVTADLIEADGRVSVHNPELVLCTLTQEIDFDMELAIEKGRGYVPASERYEQVEAEREVGWIPVDAIFSPVVRVRYKTEDTRVGQTTNYDKLTIETWTNGTVTPEMALVEASKILRKHLNPFVQYFEMGEAIASAEASAAAEMEEATRRKLEMPIGELDLGVRASNCLESARINTVADLVSRDENDLLKVRSFGKTSLREVKRKLGDLGLSLGMEVPEELLTKEVA